MHVMSFALLLHSVFFPKLICWFGGGLSLMQSLELYCVLGCKNSFMVMGMQVERWIM